MDEPLLIAWLGAMDANPAPVRLPKKALAEAAERRGETLAEADEAPIRRVVCQTRLDATIDAQFAAEGAIRGVEVVEVAWEASLRDTAQIRRVAEWLGAALRLNPVAVAFIHALDYGLDLRPAMIVPGRGVAVGAITAHNGLIAPLPVFWGEPALRATTAFAWANAAFDALARQERREAVEAQIGELNRQRARVRSDAERKAIFERLSQLAAERAALRDGN